MEIKTDYPLRSLTAFNIKVDGKYYTEVASVEEIEEALSFSKSHQLPLLTLGGGSNMLFVKNYPGLVMKVNIHGKEIVEQSSGGVVLKAGAGEVWDDLVAFCVDNGYGGLENMSLIPGCVGASPIQNIGAYGVEMKDCFRSLEFFHFESGKVMAFNAEDCKFGYRDSIFKRELKGQGVVLSVSFKLSQNPVFETGYGSLGDELESMGVKELSLSAMRTAVIRIRQRKLPDPALIGNAGSFFKNPSVDRTLHDRIKKESPGLVSFLQSDGTFKLAAGWMIDQCGWKGYRKGDAGVHEKQALVLVNYGEAAGKEIFDLSEEIKASVRSKFYVELEREVNII